MPDESAAARADLRRRILRPREAGTRWAIVAASTLLLGAVARHLDLDVVGTVLYAVVAAAFVIMRRGRRAEAAVQASIVILAVALSAVPPRPVNASGPLFVVGLCLLAVILDRISLRLRAAQWALVLFAAVFALSTAFWQDSLLTAKAAGIATMWILLTIVASSIRVSRAQITIFPTMIVIGTVSVVVALLEGLLQWTFVLDNISAGISGEYVPNWTEMLGFQMLRAQATFGYPIILGAFLAICLILIVAMPHISLRSRISFSAIFVIGILLAGARSAILAAAAALILFAAQRVFTALRSGQGKSAFRTWQVIVPVSVAVVGLLAATVFVIRAFVIGDFSFLHRSSMLSAVVDAFSQRSPLENLFGSGYGSVERGFAAGLFGDAQVAVLDNAFASMFIVTGLVGVAALLTILILALRTAGSLIRLLLATMIVEFFIFDLFSWHLIAGILFVLVGMAMNREDAGVVSRAGATP